jgi:hypothetical protein
MAREPTARKGAKWLPEAKSGPARAKLEPWKLPEVAELLAKDGDWDKVRYIVVDELHEGVAGLVVSPWPRLDDHGRLVFGEEDESRRVAAESKVLLAVLRERRLPVVADEVDESTKGLLRERRLAIGDVFAARIDEPPGEPGGGGPGGEPPENPVGWLNEPVLDITADALEAARTQMSAAVGGVFGETLLEKIGEEIAGDETPIDEDAG